MCNVILSMPLSILKVLEDNIVGYVRNWFGLNNSSNRDIMLILRKMGGLGIMDPIAIYAAKKISSLLSVLNSDDPQTQHSARSSLNIHMEKRKVTRINDGSKDPNFAGFVVDEHGRVINGTRVNWPKSIWIELNDLCLCEGVSFELNMDNYTIVSSITLLCTITSSPITHM